MEIAIASGVAALGYGITQMFRKESDEEEGLPPAFASEETDPAHDAFDDVESGTPMDAYDEFQSRMPRPVASNNLDRLYASNEDLPEGLLPPTETVDRARLPHYREKTRGYSSSVADQRRDLFAGTDQVGWSSKREVSALQEPLPGISHVYGAPVQTEEKLQSIRDRGPISMRKEGELLFDPQRVGRGLGVGPDVPAAHGFHDPTRVLPYNPGQTKRELEGQVIMGKYVHGGHRPLHPPIEHRSRTPADVPGRVGIASLPEPLVDPTNPTFLGQEKDSLRMKGNPADWIGGASQNAYRRDALKQEGTHSKETVSMRMGGMPSTHVGIVGRGEGSSGQGAYLQPSSNTRDSIKVRMGGEAQTFVGGATRAAPDGHVQERGVSTLDSVRLRTSSAPSDRIGGAADASRSVGGYVQDPDYTRQPNLRKLTEVPHGEIGGATRAGVGEYTTRNYLVPHTQRETTTRGPNPASGSKQYRPEQVGQTRLRDHDTLEYVTGPQLPVEAPSVKTKGMVKARPEYETPPLQLDRASEQLASNPYSVRPLHQVQLDCTTKQTTEA